MENQFLREVARCFVEDNRLDCTFVLLHMQHALLVAPLADVVAAAIDAEVRVLQSADALRHL